MPVASAILLWTWIYSVAVESQQPAPTAAAPASAQLFSSHLLADHVPVSAAASAPAPVADLFPAVPFHKLPVFSERLSCDGIFQDYCSKPGVFYPRNDIGMFIDENKALMRRMFGSVSSRSLIRREEEDQPAQLDNSDLRRKRAARNSAPGPQQHQTPPQLTSYLCPVEEELVTPFWAVNGTGVKLAIVNSAPFEQAVHTVKCARTATPALTAATGMLRCHPSRPCFCSQEYSWFRLLAYDPADNCKGIFMDWFKFPSHCACKCMPAPTV